MWPELGIALPQPARASANGTHRPLTLERVVQAARGILERARS
jgi:hypothetical protein